MPDNPRSFQTQFLRLGIAADTYVRPPASYFAPWHQTLPTAGGQYARYMGPLPAGLVGQQVSASQSWAAIPDATIHYLGCAQFVSDPVVGAAFAAGTWRIGFGMRLNNAAAGFDYRARAALYVMDGQRGTVRQTVFTIFAAASGYGTNTDERASVYDLVPGNAFFTLPGDCFVLEIGIEVRNTSGAPVVPQASVYADGTDDILTLFQATTSPKALLVAPYPFLRTLPLPSEQPDETVSYDVARALCVDAWPPNTHHEFEDPAPGQTRSPDAELMDWLAEVCKRWFWDFLDIWQRELDPGRAWLKLDDWKALFQIIANPAKRQDLRAYVTARLRELGVGTTPFGVASSVGTYLGYKKPAELEILTMGAFVLRAAVQYVHPIGAPIAVPATTSFPLGLRLRTPHLYDAGPVWGSGAWQGLVFTAPAGTRLHVRLTAPDGSTKSWDPVSQTHDTDHVILFAVEMAGKPVHGNWVLELYREVGSPAISLVGWTLYAPGAPRSRGLGKQVAQPIGPPWPREAPNVSRDVGKGRWKFWWGVYLDPAKAGQANAADLQEAISALSRFRHSTERACVILTKHPIPGTPQAIPGHMIPG